MNTLSEGAEGDNEVLRIVELVKQGVECFLQAAKLLVEKLDAGVDAYGQIAAMDGTGFCLKILQDLERVGRGALRPELVLDYGLPGLKLARRLPYSQQCKVLDEGVEVLVETPTGMDKLKVAVADLGPQQAKQVIDKSGRLRSDGEKKAYFLEEKSKASAKSPAGTDGHAWRVIRGGKVEFTRPCILTVKELTMIIAQAQR